MAEGLREEIAYKLAELEGQGIYCGDYFFKLAGGIMPLIIERVKGIKSKYEIIPHRMRDNLETKWIAGFSEAIKAVIDILEAKK